jgi:hypothetical protein
MFPGIGVRIFRNIHCALSGDVAQWGDGCCKATSNTKAEHLRKVMAYNLAESTNVPVHFPQATPSHPAIVVISTNKPREDFLTGD